LLKTIWLAAEKFGGRLTYDKHLKCGTLTEVIVELRADVAFFGAIDFWTKLSPSTLDRLRPPRR
jgi:hypothetical protein